MHSVIRAILIISCAFLFVAGIARDQLKADSLRQLLATGGLSKAERLEASYWLATFSSSPEEKLKYGNLTLELAQESNNLEYKIKGNLRLGVANRLLGNLGKSLEHLFAGANQAASQEAFKELLANIYAEISTCYTQNGDSENALLYGSKTIEILRKTDNKQQLALTLLNTGYDYYLIENLDSAMAYYNESEPILQEAGMTLGLAYLVGNRALVFWKQGNIQKAKTDLFQAIGMLTPLGDRYGIADYYNQLGNIFLEEGNEDQAIVYTMNGLEMAKEEGLKEQVRDASFLLFRLYQGKADHAKAIDYLVQHYAYKDSIQNLETTQRLANLRTEFEVGQKQAEVDLLLEQKRSNQIIIITGGIILFIVICLVIIVYSYSKSKNRLNKQLEEQKDSLLKLNNTKDKFFSIISHDLRGPVGMLSGLVSATKYFLDDKKTDQLGEMMDRMESSVDRLVKLLDNLLHWALQQRGHFPYSPERLSLPTVLTDVGEMFKDMAVSKNIKLELQLEDDIQLFTDRNTTSAILRNLINNAIKFTPTGGSIQVVAKKCEESNMGFITVTDNGVGMTAKKLETLFKLNENKSTKGTSGEAGLGLGLQLVYDFVHLNKGAIEVESEPEVGTTFTVRLPLDTNA